MISLEAIIMKKNYLTVEMEIIEFETEDIITESPLKTTGEDGYYD